MKVFVVTGEIVHEASQVIAVCSSKAKADDFVNRHSAQPDSLTYDGYEVEEFEVDKAT